jgi:hypothetical protein
MEMGWSLQGSNGKLIGRSHQYPTLDTQVFKVEFIDGHTAAMMANGIAENLFVQVDQVINCF